MQGGWGVSSHGMTDAELIAAAAREITARRLGVVVLLPETVSIWFDDTAPYGDSFDDVVFPNLTSAMLPAKPHNRMTGSPAPCST
jgi:hypothetical protein